MNNVIGDNRFLKVLIAAQRAKQIHRGARPLVQKSNSRATRVALEEVERGLISFEFISKDSDLKSGGDNLDVSGHDDVGVSREVTNQLSVSRLLSVGRLDD
jgi:DNA-directed RNA polymerase omega subunit